MKSIWVPISGQIAQQRKVETLANNIANANTAGFKRDDISFREHLTALDKGLEDIDIPNKEFSPDDFYRTQGAQNAKVTVNKTHTVFEQGQLSPTGNPLDVAIHGEGFFEVLTPNGIRFTRNGIFGLSKDGELVTQEGFKVLSKADTAGTQGRGLAAFQEQDPAQRVMKVPNNQKITVNLGGEIFAGNNVIGQLAVVNFDNPAHLRKEGNSVYVNLRPENKINPSDSVKLHQGFIEQSNVNAIHEMSELIKAHRHFDNIQKAIQSYDNIVGRSVNDISKF